MRPCLPKAMLQAARSCCSAPIAGRSPALRERLLTLDGSYAWQDVTPVESRESGDVTAYLDRRRARDPDLWIIELDVPNAERFAAETSGDG